MNPRVKEVTPNPDYTIRGTPPIDLEPMDIFLRACKEGK